MQAHTDADLLERFVNSADEAAFAEIVRRHGPMVYAACRRLLADPATAEDAVQAVFILLSRKARSISNREALGGWLYGAARLVAGEHARAARRRARAEKEAADMRRAEQVQRPMGGSALRPDLDAALGALPRHYRDVVVLACLEGKSEAAVAQELGLPAGTVKSRISRGLERIRARLAAAGFSCSVAVLSGLLAQEGTRDLPVELAAKLAALGAAGTAAGSAGLSLAKSALQTMFWSQLKMAAAVCAAVLAVGGAAAWKVWTPDTRNKPPVVNAGPDQTAPWPSVVRLVGKVSDDGLPNPSGFANTRWSMVSGPGTVTFQEDGWEELNEVAGWPDFLTRDEAFNRVLVMGNDEGASHRRHLLRPTAVPITPAVDFTARLRLKVDPCAAPWQTRDQGIGFFNKSEKGANRNGMFFSMDAYGQAWIRIFEADGSYLCDRTTYDQPQMKWGSYYWFEFRNSDGALTLRVWPDGPEPKWNQAPPMMRLSLNASGKKVSCDAFGFQCYWSQDALAQKFTVSRMDCDVCPWDPAVQATFSSPGKYVLRLNASDGEATAGDDLTVTVSP